MLRVYISLLSVFLIALLFGSSDRAIDKIQEARVAETAREIVVTQDWIIPHYNGELRLQKPPLTYWTTALSYKVFGVSEGAARVPSLVFALLTVFLLLYWLKQSADIQTASNAALVLVTSFLGMRYFRSAEADATLLFFISLACFSGYQWLTNASKKITYLFMLAIGLAFLSKGPAGIAIPLLTVLGYAFSKQQLKQLRGLFSPLGIIIFAVTAFAWYVWILATMPEVAERFLTRQVDETFVSGTHQQPLYWYLAHAIEFFAPWSLLLIPAGIWCYQNRPLPNIVRFALIWLLVVFVLLTFTINKQTQYALLFLPPIAIFVGHYLTVAQGRFYQFNRVLFWLLALSVLIVMIMGVRKHGVMELLYSPYAFVWPVLLVGPYLVMRALKVSAPQTPILLAAVFATFNYLFIEQHLSKDTEKDDIKQLVQYVLKSPIPIDVIYQAMPGDGAVSFYAKQPIKPLSHEQLLQGIKTGSSLWLMSKDRPEVEGAQVSQEKHIGHWSLWKIDLKQ